MSDKALVIISTGEVEKALTGLMWATNALRFGWMEDVRVIFFGPAQNLFFEDSRVKEMALEIMEAEKPIFCKFYKRWLCANGVVGVVELPPFLFVRHTIMYGLANKNDPRRSRSDFLRRHRPKLSAAAPPSSN